MTAGIDGGCVRLRLAVAEGRIAGVDVASERPPVAGLLHGREADAAVAMVPLLFALCGKAQGHAARLALDAARGTERAAQADAAIEAEAMREHLWRWLLDLPLLFGAEPMRDAFVAAAGWVAEGRRDKLDELLRGPQVASLVRLLAADGGPPAPEARLLPPLDAAASLACWPQIDPAFCARPQWQGAAAETGALARRPAAPASPAFAARWLARLEELRDWAGGRQEVGACGTASSARVGPHCGRALVETARGLLLHEVALDGGRIAAYSIVAPTEWNFHPQGRLGAWLAGQVAADRGAVQALAARAVAALDPCVRWEIEWR